MRDRHVADKELIKTVPRGTLLHRIWGCGSLPPAATAQSSEGKGQGQWVEGARESTGRHFCGGQSGFCGGNEKQWGQAVVSPPFPAPRGGRLWVAVTLSWLEGAPAGAVGDPHMFAGAVAQQVELQVLVPVTQQQEETTGRQP